MRPLAEKKEWSHNLGLKVLSLALAFGLWLYVNSQGQTTVNFAIPLEVTGLSDDLVLAEMDRDNVDIRLTGRENALSRITSRHIHAFLDLSASVPGEQWITLGKDDLQVAGQVEVSRVAPRQIRVHLERRVTREVKVVADIVGEPAPGHRISAITVEPSAVTVTGAESAFRGLARLRTHPLDLSGMTHSLRPEARLDLGGRNLEVTEGLPVYVTITLKETVPGPPSPTP